MRFLEMVPKQAQRLLTCSAPRCCLVWQSAGYPVSPAEAAGALTQGEPLLWRVQQAAAVQRGVQARQQLLWRAQQAAALQRGLQARLQLQPLAALPAVVQRQLQGPRFPGKLAGPAQRGHQWQLQPPVPGGVTGRLQLLMPGKHLALAQRELLGPLHPHSERLQPFHSNRLGALSAAIFRQVCPPAGACVCRINLLFRMG